MFLLRGNRADRRDSAASIDQTSNAATSLRRQSILYLRMAARLAVMVARFLRPSFCPVYSVFEQFLGELHITRSGINPMIRFWKRSLLASIFFNRFQRNIIGYGQTQMSPVSNCTEHRLCP